jgi:hypothetical protein
LSLHGFEFVARASQIAVIQVDVAIGVASPPGIDLVRDVTLAFQTGGEAHGRYFLKTESLSAFGIPYGWQLGTSSGPQTGSYVSAARL